MPDLLLTHGYFLLRGSEGTSDPEAVRSAWAFSTSARTCESKGFDVDVFDTTFSSREELFSHLRETSRLRCSASMPT